ncbi:hypothetical protein INS49_009461 [Diaporthe citri]|uniref:uncharacterized protein n=1 Tax=Diaporthe citri TaxID=83186 RepID=UPI001C81DB9E|nr:uncharacterized protein INS49_009461 [Diaporthe citri]KAG6361237.1 hypothetical protein INS49_009461 [Diaporthe citri]
MSDRPRFCENRDGIICDGVNGFKSIVQGFGPDGGKTSAPPTASGSVAPQPTPPSDGTPPPPPPPPPALETITTSSPPDIVTVSVTPPASTVTSVTSVTPPPSPPELVSSSSQEPIASIPPQLILPTPAAALTSTSSRGSFIESLPTRTATTLNPVNNPLLPSIFSSSDFQSPDVGPVTTFPSPATETVIATPLVSPGAAYGAIADRSTTFPAALVAGVSGGVLGFIFIFALLWRYYLRKQSQRRHAHSFADENGITHTRKDRHDPPSDRIVTTEIVRSDSHPSKSDQTRFSWAATEVSLGTGLEPLSPKPVIQQTVHRMSVPVPVEASSFRNSSKEGSMRGSFSRPTSTNQQTVPRDASAPQRAEGSSTHRSSARLQVPGTDHPQKQQDLPSQTEETEEDGEQDLVQAPLQNKGEGTGLQRRHTLRTSPLHQNPFKDAVEEESPTETPESLTFEIVNADTSPPRSTRESESGARGEERHESPPSPLHVLETITLTAEELKRASTAKSMFSTGM